MLRRSFLFPFAFVFNVSASHPHELLHGVNGEFVGAPRAEHFRLGVRPRTERNGHMPDGPTRSEILAIFLVQPAPGRSIIKRRQQPGLRVSRHQNRIFSLLWPLFAGWEFRLRL